MRDGKWRGRMVVGRFSISVLGGIAKASLGFRCAKPVNCALILPMPDRSIFFVWRYLLARFFHLIFAHGLNQIWPTANFQNRDVWLRACVTDTIDVSHRLRHLSEPSGTHPVPQSRQFPALVLIRTFKGGSLRLSGDGVCASQTGRAGSGRHSP